MGLYNFQERFVGAIQAGTKTHTIRAPRNMKEDVPGKTMHLWLGLRQPGAKRIARFECVKVEHIEIVTMASNWVSVRIDEMELSPDEKELLAWRDGFRNSEPAAGASIGSFRSAFDQMMEFWKGRLPFRGHIFHWKYDPRRLG